MKSVFKHTIEHMFFFIFLYQMKSVGVYRTFLSNFFDESICWKAHMSAFVHYSSLNGWNVQSLHQCFSLMSPIEGPTWSPCPIAWVQDISVIFHSYIQVVEIARKDMTVVFHCFPSSFYIGFLHRILWLPLPLMSWVVPIYAHKFSTYFPLVRGCDVPFGIGDWWWWWYSGQFNRKYISGRNCTNRQT